MLFVCAGGLFALAGRRGRIVGAIVLMVAFVVPWAAFAGLLVHGVLERRLDVGHALGVRRCRARCRRSGPSRS
jgi:hypothetical protein